MFGVAGGTCEKLTSDMAIVYGEAWFWDIFPWLNYLPMGVLLSYLYLGLCMIHGKTKTPHFDERMSISMDLPMNYCVKSHISNGMSHMNPWWFGDEFTWFDDLPIGIINYYLFVWKNIIQENINKPLLLTTTNINIYTDE